MTSHTQAGREDFPKISWTLVVAAGDPTHDDCRNALVRLCENYWYPVYAYVRRRGYPEAEAQDLTQDFFVRILEGRYLNRADPNRGRFRSFQIGRAHLNSSHRCISYAVFCLKKKREGTARPVEHVHLAYQALLPSTPCSPG